MDSTSLLANPAPPLRAKVIAIQGEDVAVSLEAGATANDYRKATLEKSRNLGRPDEVWEMRDENGRLVDLTLPMPDTNIFFLSMAVGFGG